ncbi:hypothetical protein [Methylobacterium gossipiicola]|uniref:Uncharacterized protein n=1 Tax=Methylobacterium gossipiicola TaxID=582675 RepID=A0A1I2TDM6_9HYPH|nr:hypothetical protein [Methylobacterium gossipiicola]SFG63074.1 hypothetical protein SAMN05192565_1079 [Methylobacterium gossipiicola]
MPSSDLKPRPPRRRVTLDAQLLTYWEREATRLEALAAAARFGWVARGYARKAERARAQAARSAEREAARGQAPEGEPEETEQAA